MTKKSRILIQRHERIIVRQEKRQKLYCDSCLREIEVLSLQELALALKTSEKEAAKQPENETSHLTKTED